MKFIYLLPLLLCVGCFSAQRSSIMSIGVDHKIELYSGGDLVRSWISDGKVLTESSSDGYKFTNKKNGKLVRVTGDLVITPK